jgi:hypothetical protein
MNVQKGTCHFCINNYFLGWDWVPKHITIGLFKAFKTSGYELANNLKNLLKSYGLTKEIITYVKDRRLI